MTSPDYFSVDQMPAGAVTTTTVNSLQSVTKESVAQASVADLTAMLDEMKDAFLNGLLGGFGNVVGVVVAAINQFISNLVYALKNITGGFIDLTGYFQDEHVQLQSTTSTANVAYTNAATAITQSEDAVTTAEAAANAAAAAQEVADIAYENASYWEAECVVASAELLLGVNELRIGLCQNVPTGRTRKITDLHIALESQPGGMTLQTKKFNSTGTSSSVIHTATFGANVTRISYNNLDLTVLDKERAFWNVSSVTGSVPPNVLQCLLFGVIL